MYLNYLKYFIMILVINIDSTFIMVGLIVILIIVIIHVRNKKNIIITPKSNNNQEFKIEHHASEILNNLDLEKFTGPTKSSKITTHKITKKIIYKNGEKVSEEITNTSNEIHKEAFTNCPNCGAKIETPNITNCPYCNTILTNVITKNS